MRYLYFAAFILLAAIGAAPFIRHRWWQWLAGVSKPVEGATEAYAVELRAMRDDIEPSPDLIRPAEQMVADHEALAEISKALDDFDRKVSDALSRFLRNQPTVLLRLPSAVEQTGEFSRRELEALLAGAS